MLVLKVPILKKVEGRLVGRLIVRLLEARDLVERVGKSRMRTILSVHFLRRCRQIAGRLLDVDAHERAELDHRDLRPRKGRRDLIPKLGEVLVDQRSIRRASPVAEGADVAKNRVVPGKEAALRGED